MVYHVELGDIYMYIGNMNMCFICFNSRIELRSVYSEDNMNQKISINRTPLHFICAFLDAVIYLYLLICV